jgi:NAD(P)-dependent dehydrogenase (short-subunit alcohol dehydrogenase family)
MVEKIFDVTDKVVVITGGLGQLGRQFCLALIDRKAKVAIFDLAVNDQSIFKRYGKRRNDPSLCFVTVDITRQDSIRRGLDHVRDKWGIPHAMINNAALDSPPNASADENGPFEVYPEESYDRVMDVNVKGSFLCCQIIGGEMAKARRGSIINICSIYGLVSPDQRIYEYRSHEGSQFYKPVTYSVSKSAILNLSRYLATYWASRNVRVNTLTFGGVFNNQDQEFLRGYCARVPLGRMAREDEYNGAVIFLVSDASSYMTGSNLVIDGGWTAW